jgi:hypothetical protein
MNESQNQGKGRRFIQPFGFVVLNHLYYSRRYDEISSRVSVIVCSKASVIVASRVKVIVLSMCCEQDPSLNR